MQFIKPGTNINFIGKRKIAFGVSVALILLSIVTLIAHKGPRYGVDFAGGTQVLVKFDNATDTGSVKDALSKLGFSSPQVQESRDGNDHLYQIRTIQPLGEQGKDTLKTLAVDLGDAMGNSAQLLSVDMVGPQVSQDLRSQALFAMFYALLFITIYISGRFELKWILSGTIAGILMSAVYLLNLIHVSTPVLIVAALLVSLGAFWFMGLRYAMGAIVALIHDVIITVGVFSVMNLEFNLPIIAALLTIIGYSLNDTIIVYDRVRENLPLKKKLGMGGVINKSINETLSRTILTSLTTLVVLVALFFFGGGIIHDFSFALLIGVVVGTYSSVFVASPILLAWEERMRGRGDEDAEVPA